MKVKVTLSRPVPSINTLPSWVDIGGGAASWLSDSVTLGAFQTSNNKADNVINPYLGEYKFILSASGTVNGGAGNTAQLTFHFLNEDHDIVESSDPIIVPNSDLSGVEVIIEATEQAPHYIAIQANNLTGSSNTITVELLYVPPESELVIAEPGGWQDHEIMLERHPEFDSLIESIFSDDRFIFIGNDNEDGDGGIDFIREVEGSGAFDEKIVITIELAPDDLTYQPYFTGLLQLEGLSELPENEIEVPIKREDAWSTFIKRFDIPVDITSNVDLDGNPVDPVEPVTITLTSQIIRKKFDGYLADTRTFDESEVSTSDYIQFDVDTYLLDEFEDKHPLPIATNPEVPQGVISVEDDGAYAFDLRIEASIIRYNTAGVYPDCSIDRDVIGSASYMNVYLQINDEDPEAFTENSSPLIFENISTIYTYTGSKTLKKGDQIKIYGDMVGNISDEGNAGATLFIHSANGIGSIMVPQAIADVPSETCGFLPASEPTNVAIAAPSLEEFPTYFKITADTTYPETQVQGFWAHDLGHAITQRISRDYILYSDVLGATFTTARQYDVDGCFAHFICIKGVHLRGYTLTDDEDDPVQRYTLQQKPFSMSMKEWWDGLHPIFNLSLSDEIIGDQKVIRVERRREVYDTGSTSVNFDFVHDIERSYEKDRIFNKITVGYEKWQTESVSGIDDPQTKHIYSLPFSGSGKDIKVVSGFIAASLAIEQTRRTTVEKSSDYKYDNDVFIIAINPSEQSPETSPPSFVPELDENFTSVTNLLHSDTRYNLILTPLRNLLRSSDFLLGCAQSYLSKKIRFQSGEGNFDMQSEYDCSNPCIGIICDELAESDHINLSEYGDDLGYLHLALLYNINLPMEWEEYKAIRENPKKAIGISLTDTGHQKFYIKQLKYKPTEGTAMIQAWPRTFFDITIPEQEVTNEPCP